MPRGTTFDTQILDVYLRGGTPVVPTGYKLALYTGSPGSDGSGPEVTGTGYARQPVTFNAITPSYTNNAGAVTFPAAGSDWGTITHAAIWSSDGTILLYFGPLAQQIPAPPGTVINFPAGNIYIQEN